MQHTDSDLTQLPTGLCVLEERKREERGEKRDKAEIRMRITRGECARDRNEGRERWGGVKHEPFEI